ncbi:unnamed protein product [Penicillium salamii]|nr:unnamed protein product [Penicillium salamii]
MSDVSPPQPTELVYWTAPRVSPRQKREYHVAGDLEPRTIDHKHVSKDHSSVPSLRP